MSKNTETVATVDAQSTSDNIDQHALHSKLVHKEKEKRKRVDQDEVEVEAIVVAESNEGGSATTGIANPQRSKKRKKKTELTNVSYSATQGSVQSAPEESVPDKKKRRNKGKGKAKQNLDVPIDPELVGDATPSGTQTVAASTPPGGFPQLSYHGPVAYPSIPYQPGVDQQNSNLVFPSPYTQIAPGAVNVPETLFQALGLNGLGRTSEEITRALQTLDLSKLADVLRQLQASAPGPAFPPSMQHPTHEQTEVHDLNTQAQIAPELQGTPTRSHNAHSPQIQGDSNLHHPPLGIPLPDEMNASQVPVPSALILGQPLRNPPKVIKSGKVSMPSIAASENSEHAYLLANKWLGTDKLKKLAEKNGLVYKRGKFSSTEEAIIKNAIEQYRTSRGLSQGQLNEVIFVGTAKGAQSNFWTEITMQVPLRPLIAVYHYVRRAYHPMKHQGKWTPEEDEAVRRAVDELGTQWEQVSEKVGRMASDCRDRWRNHLNNRDSRKRGPWTKEEEEKLKNIVTELTLEQGKDFDNDVFWAIVEERMDNERGRQQCRIKWTDALSKTVKNGGNKPRWSQQDAYILVHKIASLNVRDDSEIDWKLLSDDDWNLWSAHSLQRRWLTLKRSVRGYEDMSHQEIMDILRLKKSNMPPPPSQPRKIRVTSEATVPLDIQNGDMDMGFIAGPSTLDVGPSTRILDMRHTVRPPVQEEQHDQILMSTEQQVNGEDGSESTSGSSSSSDSGVDSDDSSDSD